MKLMHVIAGAESGGAETFFADAVAALDRAELEQVVVTRPVPSRLARLGATRAAVETAPFGNFWRLPTKRALEAAFAGLPVTKIGATTSEPRLRIAGASGEWIVWAPLKELKAAWQNR